MWVVNATPRPLYSWEKDPVPVVREGGGPRGGLDGCGKSRLYRDFFVFSLCTFSLFISLFWLSWLVAFVFTVRNTHNTNIHTPRRDSNPQSQKVSGHQNWPAKFRRPDRDFFYSLVVRFQFIRTSFFFCLDCPSFCLLSLLTAHQHLCPWQDSNPQSQQARGRRHSP